MADGGLSLQVQDESRSLEVQVAVGLMGENMMESKAGVCDTMGMLTGLLAAFGVGTVMTTGPENFKTPELYLGFASALVSSALAGLMSLMLFSFLSAKLRRLVARSRYLFGADEQQLKLMMTYCPEKVRMQLDKLQSDNSGFNNPKPQFAANETQQQLHPDLVRLKLFARIWYCVGAKASFWPGWLTSGMSLFKIAFYAFQFMVAMLVLGIVVKMADACSAVVAAGCGATALGSMVCSFFLLNRTEAWTELD
ncbi:unnamed protein product [Polarella glacialis]|uniref:H(+)-exporting diphosphatase n=1 Tax=Polarella glacialis TaxID=89957 RepID=A0A813E4W0_POLGL|nr:unnamed protein product [Polarella glacialis]CAE8628859.1 unnamed protein product [Polarella glacialis]|mmetsp:Transcript_77319/g.125175  ORF Transcript_77319/g.125175 Transcript_77319/m.125175 type:complete len:252 (-) Transcript_77319:44-799(-)|eukprot:CAMPEP_0115099540 /NCGR_PEP_ID=MMETSP0227-20121206/31926_1 /TAXON_ID=89957 /ORGANISM="Polarella glacialis, Strain CCMP 1383" /LENGTH=251 /DNA_ID=CAMNT_0002494577 /DNA_START=54 /DNA_END=809 /DNA_ORIENTATION=+